MMRQPKRIPICLDILMNDDILKKFLNTSSNKLLDNIMDQYDTIEDFWKEYPDLRFGQLLCNLRLIPSLDIENRIWNIEEVKWLVDNGYIKYEEINFWGINFYKNGKKRKKVKYVRLCDLKTDHIRNIIDYFEDNLALSRIPKEYIEYFNRRINEDK